jgi:NADP-dependent 3-hydroxy acid dehydrogenase YdfG
MEIRSKVALITGASSGIGAATAKMLAAEGVKVGLAARRIDRLEEIKRDIIAAGGEAITIQMDVTDLHSVQEGANKLVQAYGTVDFLINNAGVMFLSEVESLRVDEWYQMVDINIKGALNATAAVLPLMTRQHSGHIVNISSYAGKKLAKGLSVYSATKFAVSAFTEGLSDNSSGPEWVLVEIEAPKMPLFKTTDKPTVKLYDAIEQLHTWEQYFEENKGEKKRIFGAVAQFRYILVTGTKEAWESEHASRRRIQHGKRLKVEIRSMDTFMKSIKIAENDPGELWSFAQHPVTRSHSELQDYWENYGYMDRWRKIID